MISTVITVILLVIATEAVTEIITSSKLFSPLQNTWRQWTYPVDHPPQGGLLQSVRVFVDSLWNCGYCASVWVGGFFSLFAPRLFADSFTNWLVFVFVLHRLANWLHVAFELLRRGRVNSLDVMLRITEDGNGAAGQGIGEATITLTSEYPESGGGA